jgi:hypothetical protein
MPKAKLTKVNDGGKTIEGKEKVIQNTFEYYSKTVKAQPISNQTKYDFIEICKKSIKEINEETEKMILGLVTDWLERDESSSPYPPISMTETMRKIFQASNRSAPGIDGIPYEVLKIFPDCILRIINKIQNIMVEKAWCPDTFTTGDVFLLAKVKDSIEHKH